MIKIFITYLLIFCFIKVNSQPIITNNDMPQPGDIAKYNIASNLGSYNYISTGNNFTWDLSFLSALNNSADTFINVNATAMLYMITFNNASVAVKQSGNFSQGGMMLSDLHNFYKNSSNEFSLLGYGAKFNGITIPAKYDNPDVIYKFPLNVGNIDSSISFYELSFPGFGYYAQNKKRINHVDGWGTLYLPADTFQVIRIKSDIYTYDTIYSDSMSVGMGFNNFETEYKWLTNTYKKPVLEIIKTNISTTATFYGNINSSVKEDIKNISDFSIFPNPADDRIFIRFSNAKSDILILNIYSILGEKIFEEKIYYNNYNKVFEKDVYFDRNIYQKGIYIVSIQDNNKNYYRKFILK